MRRVGDGARGDEAEGLGDAQARRDPDIEEKRALRPARAAGNGRGYGDAMRHAIDHHLLDFRHSGLVAPDPAGEAAFLRGFARGLRQAVNVEPLLRQFVCVAGKHRLVGGAVPDRDARIGPLVPGGGAHLLAPGRRIMAPDLEHRVEGFLHIVRAAIGKAGDDRAGGKGLGVGREHGDGHRAARRQAGDEDPGGVEALGFDQMRGHGVDGGRLAGAAPGVLGQEPVEAEVLVVLALLLRQEHAESVPVGEGEPARGLGKGGGVLGAAMQHHDQPGAAMGARRLVGEHPEISRVRPEFGPLAKRTIGCLRDGPGGRLSGQKRLELAAVAPQLGGGGFQSGHGCVLLGRLGAG